MMVFKFRQQAMEKLYPKNSHNRCLLCLGKQHKVGACILVQKFTKQAHQNQVLFAGYPWEKILMVLEELMDPTVPQLQSLQFQLPGNKRLGLEASSSTALF